MEDIFVMGRRCCVSGVRFPKIDEKSRRQAYSIGIVNERQIKL